MEKVVEKLKKLIDENGHDYLYFKSYDAYRELWIDESVDRKIAAALLHTFEMGIPLTVSLMEGDNIREEVIKKIQDTCYFKKSMAEKLADIYLELFSDENEKEWEERSYSGWREFQKNEHGLLWEGDAVWDCGTGTVDCCYEATIVIRCDEEEKMDEGIAEKLEDNPFMSEDDILEYFRDSLFEALDQEFEEYCTSDDYYQPVVEDFAASSYAEDWCKAHHLTLVSCEGSGDDRGYEPKSRRYW